VPLEETDIDGPSRRIPPRITAHWTRRLAAALREDLGPILVFAPHRKAAENLATGAARDIPCPHPLRLTPEQQLAAGPQLSKLLAARVAYHHSGLSYAQRAGLIEPLAKAGQLRIVVATLGLSAGVNFSLRSVLVTGTSFTAGGLPREVAPADLLQMFGRAGRRGLDDQGYVLVTDSSPRLGQGRPATLRRATPLPWRPLLRRLAQGVPIDEACADYQRRLFTADFIPLGIEATTPLPKPLPCKLLTDTARARLVRRDRNPAPFCIPCPHRADCLALDPRPTLIWLWNRLGLLDRDLLITPRGRIAAQFVGPEGLAVAAAIEDEAYPLDELILDFANLAAGDRFAGTESRWAGHLPMACQKAYKRFSCEGFLQDGVPINYGSGGAEIIRTMRAPAGAIRRHIPEAVLDEQIRRGDIDRLLIEWRSLMRQIAHGQSFPEVPRWQQLQSLCRAELAPLAQHGLPPLPVIPADQLKAVSHRLPTI
ncbi:MAG: helicase-related protein, partial [Candidatus Methylacidiphilales bacterium]